MRERLYNNIDIRSLLLVLEVFKVGNKDIPIMNVQEKYAVQPTNPRGTDILEQRGLGSWRKPNLILT